MRLGSCLERSARIFAIILVAVVLVACTSSGARSTSSDVGTGTQRTMERGQVGRVGDTDAFVAVVVGGGLAVGYICDGSANVAEWLKGDVAADGGIDLTNDHGAGIRASLVDGRYTGRVTLSDGVPHPFSTASAGTVGGLYRVSGEQAGAAGVEAGWVVLSNGEFRGSLRVHGIATAMSAAPGETLTVSGVKLPVVVYQVRLPDVAKTPVPGGPIPIPYPNAL